MIWLPVMWARTGGQAQDTRRPAAAAAASSTQSRAPRMTASSPGRENAVMICAASGPLTLPSHEAHGTRAGPGPGRLPRTGACGQMLTGTPIPGPLAAVPDCCSPVPAGQGTAGGAGTGPHD